ncbi:hypothetical protein FB446DRAFT_614741, partial [Lentinula raphanica]
LRTLVASHISNTQLIIYLDNKGMVGCLEKGNSRGPEQNYIIGKIIELMQVNKIWVIGKWIPLKENPADPPSQGV